MIALICTVGGTDLVLDGRSAADLGQSVRDFGAELQARYEQVRERLRALRIERAIEHLRDMGEPADQVILVVSDQREGTTGRERDTCTIGEVLGPLLRERYGLQKKTAVRRLRGSPSSLDAVTAEATHWFLQWQESGYLSMYLLAHGGTTAMAAGMLLAALETASDKVTPLDVLPDGLVKPMDVARQMRSGQRRRDVLVALEHGRFGAAIDLLPAHADELGLPGHAYRALRAVLGSADARLRFDFPAAQECLAAALKEAALEDRLYQEVVSLQKGLPKAGQPSELLRELYHNAHEKLRHGEYADFVLRLFNFQQAALRQAAERAGIPFKGKGEYLDATWLQQHRDFEEFAAGWRAPDGSAGLRLDSGRATGPLLLCLAAYLHEGRRLTRDFVGAAQSVQRVVELRNRCFAAHDFHQVTQHDIEDRFGGKQSGLLDVMWVLYLGAAGHDVGSDPFKATAQLATLLLNPSR